MRYQQGLREVADGVFAYLQPDGGWGWSNAGLAVGDDRSLLVDTLFDLDLTATMLAAMGPATGSAPIRTVVNTHANGDHCYGNQLVTGAEFVTSEASAAEMGEVPPALLDALLQLDLGETTNAYLSHAFGRFTFGGIETPAPTRTFSGQLALDEAGIRADLIEVGPAHTAGDVLVHLPDTGVVFTGDILFVDSTPIVWAGPVGNWIAACDRILDLGCGVIVPGHGPLTDSDGVRAVADYLRFIRTEATVRHEAGMSAADAARDIALGSYRDWGEWERVVVNVDSVYRHLDPDHPPADVVDLFRRMAELKAHK